MIFKGFSIDIRRYLRCGQLHTVLGLRAGWPSLTVAGELRPPDPPPGRLRPPGPPEVWLSYTIIWGLCAGWGFRHSMGITPQYGEYATVWGLHHSMGITPQYGDYVQDGPVTPQDGLVTLPLWGLRADLFKKRPKFVKNRENHIKITFWGDFIYLQWNFGRISEDFR